MSSSSEDSDTDELASEGESTTEDDEYHKKDQVLIGGLNVNGLTNKSKVIKSLILSYQFDIFVITETKFTSNDSTEATLDMELKADGVIPAAHMEDAEDIEEKYELDNHGYKTFKFDRPRVPPKSSEKGSNAGKDKSIPEGQAGDKENSEPDDKTGSKTKKTKEGPGGGILIYYREDLGEVKLLSQVHIVESRIQILHLSFSEQVDLNLIAVYHPPKANVIPERLRRVAPRLDVLLQKNVFKNVKPADRVVLVGDVNLNPSIYSQLQIINAIKVKGKLKQKIKVDTRVEMRHYARQKPPKYQISHSLIDHIYVSEHLHRNKQIISSGVIHFGMSDHDLTFCNIKAPGFNPLRAHHKKSVAVSKMEDVKQSFIADYRRCEKLECLVYYYEKEDRQDVIDAWDSFKESNKTVKKERGDYNDDSLSTERKTNIICEKTDPEDLEALHSVAMNSCCAPCHIRSDVLK